MELRAAGLKEQPFAPGAEPAVFFAYDGQRKAFDFFDQTRQHNAGLGLFQGPGGSGKSTLIRQYAEQAGDDGAMAIVDAEGINKATLLDSMLKRFGYQHKFDSFNELQNMVTVFIKHQTASGSPPLLFVENTHLLLRLNDDVALIDCAVVFQNLIELEVQMFGEELIL
jgi:type II secretory pathway predicted ATPase ExeA